MRVLSLMKVATIVGARPQFIKAAVVSRALQTTGEVQEIMIHTGQHYDKNLSEVFFRELEIGAPAYNLSIGSGSHGAQTGRMLEAIEQVFLDETPDCVVVYGDTNSTLAGALAAVKLHIPVAHVEAGLRSFERIPEEINRVLTDHAADLFFAPTEAAAENLKHEGLPEASIHVVGDVMFDAALRYAQKAETHSRILQKLELSPRGYLLATVHRAENTDSSERLRVCLESLARLAAEIPVLLPVHPRTRKALRETGILAALSSEVRLIDPVGYLDMVMLEKNARLIATDSGGVQKEAYFYGVPCVTLRNTTEWTELVETGWNRLAPPVDVKSVTSILRMALESTPNEHSRLYGEGHAAEGIVQILLNDTQISSRTWQQSSLVLANLG